MRIKKTSQYIEGGASLSNVYGTSNENGYTQEYINNTYLGEVVWTNSDITQTFAEQDITLPDIYRKIEIIYARSTSSKNNIVVTVYNNYNDTPTNITEGIGIVDNKLLLRQCLLKDNKLSIYGGIIYSSYNSPTPNDAYMIPIKVIGYK